MTTIATDGKTIAADGLACMGDEPIQRDAVKIVVNGGRLYALAGTQALFPALIEWHHAGAKPADAPAKTDGLRWSLLVADGPQSVVGYADHCPYADRVTFPFAFGSGQDFATGAMEAGATPAEAVAIACRRDIRSGGEIMVVDIAEALAQTTKTVREAA